MPYLILLLVLVTPFLQGYIFRWVYKISGRNIHRFYRFGIVISVLIFGCMYVIDSALYSTEWLKNENFSFSIPISVSGIYGVFLIPLTFELISLFSKKIGHNFGWKLEKSSLLPTKMNQLLLFGVFVLIMVIFEELFCRQFLFYFLITHWHFSPVPVIFISSVLFAAAHIRSTIKEYGIFFSQGIILGMGFSETRSLLFPIALHFILNSAEIVSVYRFLRDKNAVETGEAAVRS